MYKARVEERSGGGELEVHVVMNAESECMKRRICVEK